MEMEDFLSLHAVFTVEELGRFLNISWAKVKLGPWQNCRVGSWFALPPDFAWFCAVWREKFVLRVFLLEAGAKMSGGGTQNAETAGQALGLGA
jgi:hypothetical protein